ncbi:hypothetical protein V2A60_006633 [Cordyceps javanica]|uniref:Myb-like DNA-binding domain-containing protein n=1 Tax=Cordyceps javanica TaxID=43265 RepID=A0A545W5C8_9HYPO|nr:hypothetical protein IF1G_03366 [Cordyceps javanica]TQW09199.1 hypothetical protein IF2G_03630 [Cordyceps javanica]
MTDEVKPGPTPSEAIFFFNIVQHMKNKGDIDWDAVADSSGFKNAAVAKVRFGQIKRKYGLEGDGSPTKKSGKGGAQQPGDLPPTPTKITKSRKAPGSGGRGGRKVKKQELEYGDEEGEREEQYDKAPRAAGVKSEAPSAVAAVKAEKDGEGSDWVGIKRKQSTDGFAYF